MAITKKQKQTQEQGQNAGLCDSCVHARRIISVHDSMFLLCQLGFSDARFPKYPRLPVLSCAGFAPAQSSDGEAT
jgi:hypothetical protein